MLWMLIFKVIAPLSRGEFTAGAAVINVIPNNLAEGADAGGAI